MGLWKLQRLHSSLGQHKNDNQADDGSNNEETKLEMTLIRQSSFIIRVIEFHRMRLQIDLSSPVTPSLLLCLLMPKIPERDGYQESIIMFCLMQT